MRNSAFFIMFLFLAFGCASTQQDGQARAYDANIRPLATSAVQQEKTIKPYRLRAGDVIDVKFFYTSELNETLTIRPDGKISLQLVGDVQAAGLTPSELDDFLTDQYTRELRKAEIAVIVKEFSENKVYVGGEVERPGVISLAGNLTTLQAIFDAGGFKNTAYTESVLIIRKGSQQIPVEFLTVDLSRVLTMEGDDIFLSPFDVVYVPRSKIAEVNLFVDQYINKVIPSSVVQIVQGFLYLEAIREND